MRLRATPNTDNRQRTTDNGQRTTGNGQRTCESLSRPYPSFKTAPAANAPAKLRIAFGSCVAEKLRLLRPGLGHRVHMPSHIDVRLGQWQRAIEANERAIGADAAYRALSPEQDTCSPSRQ